MKVIYYWIAVVFCSAIANSQTLTPEAKLIFTNVKSKLSVTDKNAIALKSGFKLLKNKKWSLDGSTFETVTAMVADLNSDGVEEVFVSSSSFEYYGNTGEGFSLYMKDKKGVYQTLLEFTGIPSISDQKSKGFLNIVIGGPGFEFPMYAWNGTQYKFLRNVKDSELPYIEPNDQAEITSANSKPVPDEAISANATDLFKDTKSKLTNAQKNKITSLYGYVPDPTKKNRKVSALPVDLNSDGVEEVFIHIKTTVLGIDANEYVYYVPDKTNGYKIGLSTKPMTLKIVISETKQPFPFILSGKKGLDRDVWQYNVNTKSYEFFMRAKAADANLIKIQSIEDASMEYTGRL